MSSGVTVATKRPFYSASPFLRLIHRGSESVVRQCVPFDISHEKTHVLVVDGDITYGRRLCTQVAREVETETFDGHRYEFEVLVETPDSAVSHGSELAKIFDEGLILEHTERLANIREEVFAEVSKGDD